MTDHQARLHRPHGELAEGDDPVVLTPEDAGWSFVGLRVIDLEPGVPRILATGGDEMAVLPLSARDLTVECENRSFAVEGRTSVFDRVTDFAYVPIDSEVRITSASGGEVALPTARATHRLDPAYGPAEDIPVEVRGAGPATRQVTNYFTPDSFEADKLVSVELITPDGNWSSYPPHKHDTETECEVINEEVYYFRIEGEQGFGMHRTYTLDGEIDENVCIRDGDVFLIPRGYHGPCIAAPGYAMYYLNVMAGPADDRSMAFCDDPAHHWIRDAWAHMEPDPRCPATGPGGRVDR
ncbi:MAG TPA: 5-deoxy-glucuronate isomerase [Acidimicrobiales bacterium]|nr:5-deoxy-glucuronate isomerase [Acidimicrobiales bacterium]